MRQRLRSIAGGAAADMNTAIRVEIDTNSTQLAGLTAFDASLVQTGGKLWVLNEAGNDLASAASVAALPSAANNADAVFDTVIAGGFTFEEITRLQAAVQLGTTSDGQTKIRNLEDTGDAVLVTFDTDDDRTSVTLNPA